MHRMMSNLRRSLSALLVRAVVSRVSTTGKCQMLSINMTANEKKDAVEQLEPYGLTSAPHEGAEALAVFPDGDRSHGVVLVVADRRWRIKGLVSGEVALYSDEGDHILLKRGNRIEVSTREFIVNATEKIVFNTPELSVSGRVTVKGNMESDADVKDKTTTMAVIRTQYNGHTHQHGDPATGMPDRPVG